MIEGFVSITYICYFFCVLSIFALIWLVLMALFCAAIRRNSVSLLKFPFLGHVPDFLCELLFISRLKRPSSCFSSYFCFLIIVLLLVIVLLLSLFHTLQVFHWSLTKKKSPLVSRTLLSILANLTNALVWIVSILFLIFSSSSLFFHVFEDSSKRTYVFGVFMIHPSTSYRQNKNRWIVIMLKVIWCCI